MKFYIYIECGVQQLLVFKIFYVNSKLNLRVNKPQATSVYLSPDEIQRIY